MTSDAILTELRSLPGAPEGLRERVRAMPEPKPRFAWTLPRIDIRRVVLVAAPALVAIGVGAAALNGLVEGGSKTPQPVALEAEQHGGSCAGYGGEESHAGLRRARPPDVTLGRSIAQRGAAAVRDATQQVQRVAARARRRATVSPRRRPARCRSRAATAATSRPST